MAKKQFSAENKAIARRVAATFGCTTPKVQQFLDENEKSEIDILICEDRPEEGVFSFGTIGLSDYAIPGQVQPPLGAEIVGLSDQAEFAHVLATASFCVINDEWVVEPGRVFPGVVGAHFDDITVPNLMFVDPYLWENDLQAQAMESKTVAWVLGLPITDAEMELVREHGPEALENILEQSEIDIYDLQRPSVV